MQFGRFAKGATLSSLHESTGSSDGFVPGDVPKQVELELEAAFGEFDVSFSNTEVRVHALGTDVLGDASWTEFPSGGSGSHGRVAYTVHRTFAFFHRPDTTLPEFTIQARRGIAGKYLFGPLSRMMGMPSFTMDDSPEFNEKFTVMTSNSESVRALLGQDFITAMVAIEDIDVTFVSRGVLVHRHPRPYRSSTLARNDHDERLEGSERRRFIDEAVIAASPVVDDPEAGRRAADAVAGSYAEESLDALKAQGGMVGRAVAKMVVTAEMLEEIRTQSPPRRVIPGPVRRRAWAGWTFPFVILACIALAAIAIGLVVLFGSSSGGMWWVLELVGLLFAGIAGYVGYSRHTLKRIVISGVVMPGRITSVEKTTTSVNDDVIHEITILPSAEESAQVVVKAGSVPAKAARRMMERDQETWILADPKKPTRGLWPAGWTVEALMD